MVFDFKPDVDFAQFPFLPPYWSTMLGMFGTRGGLSGKVLAQSEITSERRSNTANGEQASPGQDIEIPSSKREMKDDTSDRKKKKSRSNEMAAALSTGFETIGEIISRSGAGNSALAEMKGQLDEQTQLLKQLVSSIDNLAKTMTDKH
jgi:seryl-tRNA synthetase